MALELTATLDAATHSVTLRATGGTPEYSITAVPAGDRDPYVIRSTYSKITGDASGRVAIDGELPLNTPTQYVVTDATGAQASSTVVETTSDDPVLSDALDPGRALPVVVVSQKPNRWEARSVWFDVLGQREPFAAIAPLRLRSGRLVLRASTRGDRAALLPLFEDGHPLVLRSACPAAVDDLVLLPLGIDEELVVTDAPAGATHLVVEYQAVSRELGPVAVDPGRTYATVLTEAPTYAALATLYATYDGLRAGDPGAGLDVEQISNGDFAAGGTSWDYFWSATLMVPDYSGGTARWVAPVGDPTSRQAVLTAMPRSRALAVGQETIRVAGRVRSTSPLTTTRVQLLTNDATGAADYFAPGVAMTDVIVPASTEWQSFAVDVAVPAPGDTKWSLVFRADGMRDGAVVEWDDLSARWRV